MMIKYTITKSFPNDETKQSLFDDQQDAIDHLHDVFIDMGIDVRNHAHWLDPFPVDKHGPSVLVWCRNDAIVSCNFPVELPGLLSVKVDDVSDFDVRAKLTHGEPYKVQQGTVFEHWAVELTIHRGKQSRYAGVFHDETMGSVMDFAKRICELSK